MVEQEIRKILEDGTNMTAHDIEKHIRDGLAIYEDIEEGLQDFRDDWVSGMNDLEEARSRWGAMDLIKSNGKRYKVDFFN